MYLLLRHLQLRVCLLSALFISTTCFSFAQPAFTPATEDVMLLKQLFSKYEQKYRIQVSLLPEVNKKDFAEIYKLRWQNIKEKFDTREIFTSTSAQQYLDVLVAEVVKANPVLQKQSFNCYFSRSGVPNASYIGEGVILFNMGLFSKLENESQAVFVLCHEIAHFILNHSENSIRDYVNTINSKQIQQELRKIKNTEFKKRDEIEKLMRAITFNSRRHSRDHENEADSMAVELMRKTNFDVRESLSALSLLDSVDLDNIETDRCLRKLFDAKRYPFKDKWLAKEEGLLGGHAQLKDDETLADSVKTHPDCKTRIKVLSNHLDKLQAVSVSKDVVDKIKFTNLKHNFRYEIIEYAFLRDNYTFSLYTTLQLLEDNPSDPYLVTQLGKIFNGLYNAQKNHILGKVTSLPSPGYPANYNLLLQFIQNLYKEDFASINYHYLNQYTSQLQHYSPFKQEYNLAVKTAQQ